MSVRCYRIGSGGLAVRTVLKSLPSNFSFEETSETPRLPLLSCSLGSLSFYCYKGSKGSRQFHNSLYIGLRNPDSQSEFVSCRWTLVSVLSEPTPWNTTLSTGWVAVRNVPAAPGPARSSFTLAHLIRDCLHSSYTKWGVRPVSPSSSSSRLQRSIKIQIKAERLPMQKYYFFLSRRS